MTCTWAVLLPVGHDGAEYASSPMVVAALCLGLLSCSGTLFYRPRRLPPHVVRKNHRAICHKPHSFRVRLQVFCMLHILTSLKTHCWQVGRRSRMAAKSSAGDFCKPAESQEHALEGQVGKDRKKSEERAQTEKCQFPSFRCQSSPRRLWLPKLEGHSSAQPCDTPRVVDSNQEQ